MKQLQEFIERVILTSRYLLVVFYVGLAASLAIYAVAFVFKLIKTAKVALAGEDMVLPMLVLIDSALISGLIVMVMLSSYENFVSRFDTSATEDSPDWLRRLDPGSLKVKVATALLTISAVQLLQVFLDMEKFTEKQIMWKVIIHMVFIASALCLAGLDRLTTVSAQKLIHKKPDGSEASAPAAPAALPAVPPP
ncbi:MAG TPA: hypothetical protein DCL48_14380 [Alphaproteobacteria bacterium]|nr:hypothetical protein [Alphaproteobacteria bacterium]